MNKLNYLKARFYIIPIMLRDDLYLHIAWLLSVLLKHPFVDPHCNRTVSYSSKIIFESLGNVIKIIKGASSPSRQKALRQGNICY